MNPKSLGPLVSALIIFGVISSPVLAGSEVSYEGTVGTAGIGMTLYAPDKSSDFLKSGNVAGKYFYSKYLKDIKLDGTTDGNRGIILYEYDAEGKKIAVIKATFPEKDPGGTFGTSKLTSEVITGTWSSLQGDSTFPLSLRMTGATVGAPEDNPYSAAGVEDAKSFERSVQKFRNAVIGNDRKTVASMIKYPVFARLNNKQQEIHNAKELLANYETIFSKKYTKLIKQAVPHNMFARYDGVMLGSSGEVWFDATGKVETLNN